MTVAEALLDRSASIVRRGGTQLLSERAVAAFARALAVHFHRSMSTPMNSAWGRSARAAEEASKPRRNPDRERRRQGRSVASANRVPTPEGPRFAPSGTASSSVSGVTDRSVPCARGMRVACSSENTRAPYRRRTASSDLVCLMCPAIVELPSTLRLCRTSRATIFKVRVSVLTVPHTCSPKKAARHAGHRRDRAESHE
jgi:hypothetical protein